MLACDAGGVKNGALTRISRTNFAWRSLLPLPSTAREFGPVPGSSGLRLASQGMVARCDGRGVGRVTATLAD